MHNSFANTTVSRVNGVFIRLQLGLENLLSPVECSPASFRSPHLEMEYLIRFAQIHESFRRVELEALADLLHIDIAFLAYNQYVRLFPFKVSMGLRVRSLCYMEISWTVMASEC